MSFQLTKEQQERIQKARSKAEGLIQQQISNFYEQLDKLLEVPEKKESTFWDKLSIIPSLGYDLVKGAFDGIIGAGQGINIVITNFVNDFRHVFDDQDKTSWDKDLQYAISNLGINIAEGLGTFAVSTLANLGRLGETGFNEISKLTEKWGWNNISEGSKNISNFFNPDWAFGEGGAVQEIEEGADELRVAGLNGKPNLINGNIFDGKSNQEIVDDRYYKETEAWLRGSVNVQNFIEEKITDPIIGTIYGDGKEKAQEVYGDGIWYETLSGVSNSVGNILAMWGMTKLAGKVAPKAPAGFTKAVGTSYFFSTTTAQAYQDAINNGIGLADAYTYALGQGFSETLIENIGGFGTGDTASTLFKRLKDKGIFGLIKEMGEEGLEEVVASYGGTGFKNYLGESMDQSNKDFYSEVIFSFVSGALASMALGGARNTYFNLTVDGKTKDFYKSFEQDVKTVGEEKAVQKVNKKLQNIVNGLNGNGLGVVFNEKGNSTTKKMNTKEKMEFIKRNHLSPYITQGVGGTFIAKPVTADMFKNRINTGKKNEQGEAIYSDVEDGKYAINSNVKGVDISDEGRRQVIESTKLNKNGQRALEIAEQMDVPIAIYEGPVEDAGAYGKNGVLYINQTSLNDFNIERTIIKHEMVHAIADNASPLYQEIQKTVDELVKISFNNDKSLKFVYKNKEIKNLFIENGVESMIENNIFEYIKGNLTPEEVFKMAQEEVVAYFIENMLEDSTILRVLSKEKTSLIEKIKQSFETDENIDKLAGGSVKIAKQVKRIKANFERGAREVVRQKKTVGYLIEQKTKDAMYKKFMKGVQEKQKEVMQKVTDLTDAVIDFSKVTGNEIEVDRETLINDNEKLFEEIMNAEQIYQELLDDDKVTKKIQKAYDDYQQALNSLNTTQAQNEKLKKTKEGFNIVPKRKTLDPDFLKDSIMRNEDGSLKVFYHGTSNNFKEFSDAFIGSNTSADNTKFGHFFTANKGFAQRFTDIYNEGEKGKVYHVYLDVKKIIRHPYALWHSKLSLEEKNKVVIDYLKATDNYENFLNYLEYEGYEDYDDSMAYEVYDTMVRLDLDYEPYIDSENDKKALIKNGYDAIIINEGQERFVVENSLSEELVEAIVVFSAKQVYVIEGAEEQDSEISYNVYEDTIGDETVTVAEFKLGESYLKIFENSSYANGRNSIYDFWVDPDQRQKGIGTRLLNEAKKHYSNISAQVSNEASVRTHYKAGFRVTGSEDMTVEQSVEAWKQSRGGSINMEYREVSEPVMKRKTNVAPAMTDKERQAIRNMFSDEIIAEFFELDKSGNYVLKSNRITAQSKRQNYITLNGKKFKSSEYAINVYNSVGDYDISNYIKGKPFDGAQEPLKLSELTKEEQVLHKFFSSTRLNYILYRNENSGTGGYSLPMNMSKANVVFINTKGVANSPEFLADTMVHEHFHEAFKYAELDARNYAYQFSDVLFKPVFDTGGNIVGVKGTEVWDMFAKKYGYTGGGFFNYFNSHYGSKQTYSKIKNEFELFKLLQNSKGNLTFNQLHSLNEVMAQITGTMFSSKKIYKTVLEGKSNEKYVMYELYDKLMSSPTIDANTRTYLEKTLQEFKKLFDNYMKEVAKVFPSKDKYTLAELNNFIKEFTNGQYNTKSELLADYFKEKSQKIRAKASVTVDNIIYIASIFGKTVKESVEIFTQLQNEFKVFKEQIEMIITNPDSLLLLNGISAQYNKLDKGISLALRVFNKKYKGKVNYVLDESMFVDILDAIDAFETEYNYMDADTLSVFSLPDKQVVRDILHQLANETNAIINQIIINGSVVDMHPFAVIYGTFKNTLSSIGDVKTINSSVFGKIKQMQTALRLANVKNILFAINRSVKNVKKSLQSMSRNAESAPNQEFIEVEEIIGKIYKAIADNAVDFNEMKLNLKILFEQLRVKIQSSNVVGNELAKSAIYLPETTQKNKDENEKIRLEIQAEVAELKRDLIEVRLFEIYEQFAFLFNDKSFVQDKYDLDKYKYLEINKIVKEFKENKVANHLASILREFQTVFETVFKDGVSLNAYAKDNHDKILAIKDTLKTQGMNGVYLRGVTPQEILKIYIGITDGKMDFFKDFYNAYVGAVSNQETIIATFDRAFVEWNKSHKKNIQNSVEEVEVDMDYFIEMDNSRLEVIINEADKKIAEVAKQIKVKQSDLKVVIDKRKSINEQIKQQAELKRKSIKGSKLWSDANARSKALKSQKDKVIADEQLIRDEIDALKNSVKLMDKKLLIKEALIKISEEKKKKNTIQKMQRGHLVSLYMSIKREIEMHEMAKNGNLEVVPTNHFEYGNQVVLFDNTLLENPPKKLSTLGMSGYKYAKTHARSFTIFEEDKQKILDYIESLLNDMDIETMDFARETFDKNYEFANEMYKAKYQVDLTKQPTYIPFSTTNADKTREFELKRVNRNNIGVDKGFIMKTTLGASQDLQIENIFSVMDSHTRTVSRYSFDRINTDFQNLLVNKTGGTSFQNLLSGNDTIFGTENGVEDNINRMLSGVLQYNDLNEAEYVKFARKVLRNTVRAVIGLAIPMYIKQYLSMMTIASKNKISFVAVLKGTAQSTKLNNKYFRWLMDNNDNFYLRAKNKFIPNLSDYATQPIFGLRNRWLDKAFKTADKVADALTRHVGNADARVLVGAFRAKADEIRKANPKLSEDEVLEKANEWLNNEVMLFGVANTHPAYRSALSNSKNLFEQMAGKFQSENLIHYSAIVRNIILIRNNEFNKNAPMLTRDLLAFLLSGIFSALVSNWWEDLLEYEDNSDKTTKENIINFVLDDLFWQNMLGSIPYLNQATQMIKIEFDEENGFTMGKGFDPRIPLYSELENIRDDWSAIDWRSVFKGNVSDRDYRKMYEVIEEMGHMLGMPIKNARKIAQIIGSTMGEYGSERGRELDRLFNNETRTTAYYEAIKEGNQSEINGYVREKFDNLSVKNEIVKLMMNNPKERIKIYNEDNFRSMNDDGEYETYDIPKNISDKYKGLTQRALQKLIRNSSYRRLDDINKIKTIQRVINYYYNYMKAVILYDLKKKDKPADMSDLSEVVERSIQYAIREIEEAKRKRT